MSKTKRLALLFCLVSIFMAAPAIAQSADGNGTLSEGGRPAAPDTAPVQPATPEAERHLHFLQTLDYKSPLGKSQFEFRNLQSFLNHFDIIIQNGLTKEADAEMQRLASEELSDDLKRNIADAIFKENVRVLEHAEPLVKNNFFEYCIGNGSERQQYLAYEFVRFFNTQKTVQDKLKAAAVFQRVFYPVIKERAKSKDLADTDYLLPSFSIDDLSDYPIIGGTGVPPTIEFTYPPEALPKFSNTPIKGAGKEGKYLIVRKLQGGKTDVDYFIDLAMMSSLPSEYFPEDISKVTRLVVVDSQWKQDGKFNNGTLAFAPRSTITVYDYNTGKLIAKIGEHNQNVSGFVMMRKDTKKYFSEVNKVDVCKKIIDWLNKKKP